MKRLVDLADGLKAVCQGDPSRAFKRRHDELLEEAIAQTIADPTKIDDYLRE